MSVELRISYDQPYELDVMLDILQPVMKKHKIAKKQDGRHKNAYVTIRDSALLLTEAKYRKMQ